MATFSSSAQLQQQQQHPQHQPLYSPPFCDFVLLAEFDIDRGSIIRRQYPDVTGIAENTLAESMLPEGAHLRETGLR